MIKSIEFIRDLGNGQLVGKNIELGAPDTSGLWVKSIKGIGPGKANINITDMASSDGGIYNSSRSEVRNITVTLGIIDYVDETNEYHSVEDVRRDIYKIFGKKRDVEIRIHTDYLADEENPQDFILYTNGYIESCDPDIFNKMETVSISVLCPDPNFYNLYGYSGVEFSATESAFEFPINQEESSDNPFIYGQFYYEYNAENDEFFISEDVTADGLKQERKPGKTYYTGGLSNDISSGEREYIVTTDESFAPGKEYFREDPNNPGQFMMAPELEMITDHEPSYVYYEYNNKILFANILEITKKDIYYDGEIEVGVIINLKFKDAATGVKIYKILEPESEIISLDDQAIASSTGGAIAPGDEITICTIPGHKYAQLVRDAVPHNIMNAIGRNPSWFMLEYGLNSFTYSADSGQEFIDVSISYNPAYEGV